MDFIKNNLLSLIIIVIVMVVLFKTCGGETIPPPPPVVTVIRDTVYFHTDSTVYNQPQITESIPYPVDRVTKEYLPDTSYGRLVNQYRSLVEQYMAVNISLDSIRIDSIGYVRIVDSVSKNAIAGRSVTYKLKYPITKETITKIVSVPQEKKRQLYVGGGFVMEKKDMKYYPMVDPVFSLTFQPYGSLLYKTKKDYMIGVNAGINKLGTPQYGLVTYLKLK